MTSSLNYRMTAHYAIIKCVRCENTNADIHDMELPKSDQKNHDNCCINQYVKSCNNHSQMEMTDKNMSCYRIDYCAITFLDLSRSQLTKVSVEIKDIKNLLCLNLSHNYLQEIPDSLFNSSLSTLIVSFNLLTVNQSLIDTLSRAFPSLKKLNASYQNDINGYNVKGDCDCVELNFSSLQSIESVNFSGNKLSSLTTITGHDQLKQLILHSNCLNTLPQMIDCHRLEVLDVSNNWFDEKFSGRHLDILMDNCPLLKHLDIISANDDDAQWHLNARKAINCCHSLGLSENSDHKMVHFVDTGLMINECNIAVANSYGPNNVIAIEPFADNEWIIVLVNGSSLAPIIKCHLMTFLEAELSYKETSIDYLKNCISLCYHILNDRQSIDKDNVNLKDVNIILAHVTLIDQRLRVKVATCGHRTSLKKVKSGNDQCGDDVKSEAKIVNLCTKFYGKMLSAKSCNNTDVMTKSDLLDPIYHEIDLTSHNGSSFLMGINISDHDEDHLLDSFSMSSLTLSDKLKKYCEMISAKNANYDNHHHNHSADDCLSKGDNQISFGDNFLAVAIEAKRKHQHTNNYVNINDNVNDEPMGTKSCSSGFSNSDNSMSYDCLNEKENDLSPEVEFESEHSEKYRSWEYMLEANHKCIFQKELEATINGENGVEPIGPIGSINGNKNNNNNRIFFSHSKKSQTQSNTESIITLPQFTIGNNSNNSCDRFKMFTYDLNAFKVYKI